jgi:hypothetical protein
MNCPKPPQVYDARRNSQPETSTGDSNGNQSRRVLEVATEDRAVQSPCYWLMALAVEEKALLAFAPIKRMVPTTKTRITANITAYSAIS